MKKIIIAAVSLLFAVSVQAAELKIGYVDLNKALNMSVEGKKAVKTLENMVKARQTIIDEKGTELKKLDEEIAKQASILNPGAIKDKRDQREKLTRDYQRMIKDSQDEVQKSQAEFMKAILLKIRTVVAKIGEKEGYSVIFERAESGILYIPDNVNLTDLVIEKFDKAVKAGEFKK